MSISSQTASAANLLGASGRTLSKSDFKLARDCDAKLFFRENHYPDNSGTNPYLALLAFGGYMVDALAKATRDGIEVGHATDVAGAYTQTVEHLKRDDVTLFEAVLLHNRRQARIDIIEKKGNVVRLLEVKAKSFDSAQHAASLAEGKQGLLRSTRKPYGVLSDWKEKIEDVAFQTILLERVRPDLVVRPYLVLVDKGKVAGLDNVPGLFDVEWEESDGVARVRTARFIGSAEMLSDLDLLTEIDVSEEVAMVREAVDKAAARLESLLDEPLSAYAPTTVRGSKCMDCEFRVADDVQPNGFFDCWGPLAGAKPHVLELYKVGQAKLPDRTSLVEGMIARGTASLLDVPLESFELKLESPGANGNRQRRQIEHTRANSVYCGDELRAQIARLESRPGPFHFIDFETSRLALPYHKGMRPYGLVAFQWSCHSLDSLAPGPALTPRHSEFLNMTDIWPNQAFAQSLREAIGDSGSVLTWSHFEGTTLKQIEPELSRFGHEVPELVDWMDDVVENRIVDLHEWARCYYYNPGMRGRTSIKVVLDALWNSDPAMRAQFSAWTGRSGADVLDPYRTLPPVEIAGTMQDVHEGTGAMRAYQEMMYGAEKNDPVSKAKWAGLLRQYCALDTLSMVLILEHWRRLMI